jgi:hypothetical protein
MGNYEIEKGVSSSKFEVLKSYFITRNKDNKQTFRYRITSSDGSLVSEWSPIYSFDEEGLGSSPFSVSSNGIYIDANVNRETNDKYDFYMQFQTIKNGTVTAKGKWLKVVMNKAQSSYSQTVKPKPDQSAVVTVPKESTHVIFHFRKAIGETLLPVMDKATGLPTAKLTTTPITEAHQAYFRAPTTDPKKIDSTNFVNSDSLNLPLEYPVTSTTKIFKTADNRFTVVAPVAITSDQEEIDKLNKKFFSVKYYTDGLLVKEDGSPKNEIEEILVDEFDRTRLLIKMKDTIPYGVPVEFKYTRPPVFAATLVKDSYVVTLTAGSTSNLSVGESLTKISGAGAFGASTVITDIGPKEKIVGSKIKLTANQIKVSVKHSTKGSVTFSTVQNNIEIKTGLQDASGNAVPSFTHTLPSLLPREISGVGGATSYPVKIQPNYDAGNVASTED